MHVEMLREKNYIRIEFTCCSADVYWGKGYASWKQEYGNMDDSQGAKAYRLTNCIGLRRKQALIEKLADFGKDFVSVKKKKKSNTRLHHTFLIPSLASVS